VLGRHINVEWVRWRLTQKSRPWDGVPYDRQRRREFVAACRAFFGRDADAVVQVADGWDVSGESRVKRIDLAIGADELLTSGVNGFVRCSVHFPSADRPAADGEVSAGYYAYFRIYTAASGKSHSVSLRAIDSDALMVLLKTHINPDLVRVRLSGGARVQSRMVALRRLDERLRLLDERLLRGD